jgi:hypothetical protein
MHLHGRMDYICFNNRLNFARALTRQLNPERPPDREGGWQTLILVFDDAAAASPSHFIPLFFISDSIHV